MRPRSHLRVRTLGLVLAVLALFGQVSAAWATAPPASGPQPGGPAFPICHASLPDDAGGTAPAAHHDGLDCALCPLCTALAAAALLPQPGPDVPPTAMLPLPAASPPPARAPPATAVSAATYPTGPPRRS